MKPNLENSIRSLVQSSVDSKRVFGTVFGMSSPRRGVSLFEAAGDLSVDSSFFLASATKLYITALLLQLREEGVIDLDDSITRHLPPEVVRGLIVYRGEDLSARIRIRDLMAHTAGLPDYFQATRAREGTSLLTELEAGEDLGWTFEEVVEMSKTMKPHFAPQTPGRAHYSDTGFQLLGRILENRLQEDLPSILRTRVFDRLGLRSTYLYRDPADRTPVFPYFKKERMEIPKAMASFGPDGGMVSNVRESLTFVEAFFGGRLFDASVLPSLMQWNRIFFPMQSGVGLHLFRLPWPFSLFRRVPDLVGHSGLSGAFLFYCPDQDVYLAGTVNQVAYPEQSFRLMAKVVMGL